jgi:hypothetical protein
MPDQSHAVLSVTSGTGTSNTGIRHTRSQITAGLSTGVGACAAARFSLGQQKQSPARRAVSDSSGPVRAESWLDARPGRDPHGEVGQTPAMVSVIGKCAIATWRHCGSAAPAVGRLLSRSDSRFPAAVLWKRSPATRLSGSSKQQPRTAISKGSRSCWPNTWCSTAIAAARQPPSNVRSMARARVARTLSAGLRAGACVGGFTSRREAVNGQPGSCSSTTRGGWPA